MKKPLSTIAAFLLAVVATLAISLSPVWAASISQGYATNDKDLKIGMLVSLSPDSTSDKRLVEQTGKKNRTRFVGIVTTINASLLTLTAKDASIYVTTEGATSVLASNLNGTIKKGDNLTVSPLKGLIMRADSNEPQVLGTALENFNTATAKSQQVNNTDGSKRTVAVGAIRIELNPHNLAGINDEQKPFLVLFGQSITGRPVNQWQVVSALVILFILLVVEGSIVYGAVHSTITALGRNPLAKKAVYKQLFQVFLLVSVILLFGMGAIYAVLWA